MQSTYRLIAQKEGAQIHNALKLKTPPTHKPIGNRQMKIRVLKTEGTFRFSCSLWSGFILA